MRRVILAVTGTVVGLVLLLSFKTGSSTAIAAKAPATVSTPAATGGAHGDGDGDAAEPTAAAASPSASSTASRTVTGEEADTRYGPVQVQVVVTKGVITSVQAVEHPEYNGRDAQINAYAVPVLQQEAVAAKSASIDAVSGATYTSEGFITSLQSALSQLS